MPEYRFYLLSPGGHIVAGEYAECDNDSEAVEFSIALQFACSDVFEGCEAWRGTERVSAVCAGEVGRERRDLDRILSKWAHTRPVRQEKLLALEHRLQESFVAVRKSQVLIEECRKLLEG